MFFDILELKNEFIVILVWLIEGGEIENPQKKPIWVKLLKFLTLLFHLDFEYKMGVNIQRD